MAMTAPQEICTPAKENGYSQSLKIASSPVSIASTTPGSASSCSTASSPAVVAFPVISTGSDSAARRRELFSSPLLEDSSQVVFPALPSDTERRDVGSLADRLGLAEEGVAGDAAQDAEAKQLPPCQERVYWEGFVVNLPVFCGYAALFGLQHEVKDRYGITDSNSPLSIEFGVACSFLYIFNLIFRFSHNVVFCFMGPFGRTIVAMLAMMLSMITIAGPIMSWGSKHLGWVYLAYALGGISIGTFEGNLLCCLTPLGDRTKHLAIIAIPVGVTSVLVGGFFVMGPPFYIPATAIYMFVAAFTGFGILLFVSSIPRDSGVDGTRQSLQQFIADSKEWRQWLPVLWHYPFATMIDMFTLSAFSPGVALYIWDTPTVTIYHGVELPTKTFFAIFNLFNMCGGLLGRYMSYRVRPRHPIVYTSLSLLGIWLMLQKIPLLAILSTLIIMIGNGFIYGSIARHIDAAVPKRFNLVAISFWLFVGDFGSVAGSNLISYIRMWVVGS